MILYLPFDDPDNSTVAYDYSKSRADAKLSGGAAFTRDAKFGKALALHDGEALTAEEIPFDGDFTLSMYIKSDKETMGWLLNFDALDTYLEQWFGVSPNKWHNIIFVKKDNSFTVFLDLIQIYTTTLDKTPVGLSINDDTLLEDSTAIIDEVRLYNEALDLTEILIKQDRSDVEYYINGVNFKEFGVFVSKSNGLLPGYLERKDLPEAEFDTYHGLSRDTDYLKYKERTITLECFVDASSRYAFVDWAMRFAQAFQKKGTQRLKVEYAGITKPLVYEVVMLTGFDPEKTWARYNEQKMVGTFTLTLTEDSPVKRVVRHIGAANSTAKITLSSVKRLDISWGDGSHTYGVRGQGKTITHTYESEGEYDIVIAGNIEDIEDFSTNGIIVWQTLM